MMLMYALCICTDRPFHFSESDMVSVRKWWCVQLMERFSIEGHGQRFAFWTQEAKELLHGGLEPLLRLPRRRAWNNPLLDQSTTVQDLYLAVQWIDENPGVFKSKWRVPAFHGMTEQEQEDAVRRLLEDNGDDTDARDPFMFVFDDMDDMETFMNECRDQRDLRVNVECVADNSE
ncbi:uncharacterized protein ACB058_010338 [Synchiropus picturatus]